MTDTKPSMRRPFESLIDHRASVAAYRAVQEDTGDPEGPIVSYATVALVIETFLRERDRLNEAQTEAEQYLRSAAAADTHSSDTDPGRVDPWSER